MDILVSEKFIGSELDSLHERFRLVVEPDVWRTPSVLQEMIPAFDALVVRNHTRVTRELIAAGKKLRVIGRAGVGLDNVDVAAANDHGVVVAFTPEQNTNSVVELTIGLLFALARKLPAADRDTRNGGWDRPRFNGIELAGKTLGVVGLGRIGGGTAAKARALGMEILACDPYLEKDCLRALETRAQLVELEDLLERSDFVSCHVPLTEETTNLFDAQKFSRMKSSAYFLNASRGGVVVEADLIRALQEKRIAGAALDVRAEEPPAPTPLS
jgi:D-3-phosphoglycerate dehydrogenase / 2-oxoglutarate reductase